MSKNPAATKLAPAREAAARYLELLRRCLTRELFLDEEVYDLIWWPDEIGLGDPKELWSILDRYGFRIVRPNTDHEDRREGRDYPRTAETMVGAARLENLQRLVERVLAEGVPGDLVETGVWRGGAIILMRAVLEAYGDTDRLVWACDSFQGLPDADLERYPMDASVAFRHQPGLGDDQRKFFSHILKVSLEEVKANIDRYGLLDERIRFLPGWFSDTLPDAPIDRIAVLRLDGDLYQSTIDALVNLEPRVSPGGFVIVDDYNSIDVCRQAVSDYRDEVGIKSPIHEIDWTGVWWQKAPAGS